MRYSDILVFGLFFFLPEENYIFFLFVIDVELGVAPYV